VAAAPLVAVTALGLDLHDVVLLAVAGRVVGRQAAAEEADVLIQVVEAVPHRAAGPRLDRVVVVVGAAGGTADVGGVRDLDAVALVPGDGGLRGGLDLRRLRAGHQEGDHSDGFLAALRRQLVRAGAARDVADGIVLRAPDGLDAALDDLGLQD